MDIVRDVSSIIGLILSAAALFTLFSNKAKEAIAKLFGKYGQTKELSDEMAKMKVLLEDHIAEENKFRGECIDRDRVATEFMKTQCRNIIKTMFYNYKDDKILPLYDKQMLIFVKELYINRLHGNSFAAVLLEDMEGWDVDYDNFHPDDLTE